MRIRIMALAVLCICLTAGLALAADGDAQYGIIQGGSLHMREAPSQEAAVAATYDSGTWVQIVAQADEVFDEVIAEDGQHGYMMTGYILPDTVGPGDWGTVENGGRHVNLRSGPSKEDGVIGHVSTGDRFELLAYGDSYSMVRFDGTSVGYIASSMILLDGEAEHKQETTHSGGQGLSLYAAPAADSQVIDSLPSGTEVTVLIEGKTWSKVFVDDSFGYMHTASLVRHTKAQHKAEPTPNVQMHPPLVTSNPALVMAPGPVQSGSGMPPYASHPRGGPLVTSYDFTPDESFHDGVGQEVSEDQLDG